jgi:hypothetical protein
MTPVVLTVAMGDELVHDKAPWMVIGLPLESSAVAVIAMGAAPTRVEIIEGEREKLATVCTQAADAGEDRFSVEPGTMMDAATIALPSERQVSSALGEIVATVGVEDCQLASEVTSFEVPSAYERVAASCAFPLMDIGVATPEMLSVGEVQETGTEPLRCR